MTFTKVNIANVIMFWLLSVFLCDVIRQYMVLKLGFIGWQLIDGWIGGRMNEWNDGCMYVCMYVWLDGWLDG